MFHIRVVWKKSKCLQIVVLLTANQRELSDKSISFHTFPTDALRLAIWLKYCVSGFKPSKHSVLCSLHFDPSLMTWTPRRKSNRLANSKLNPIDLDAHSEAEEPQKELDIVNVNTPVKVSGTHSESETSFSATNTSVQHNKSPIVSLPSVRRRLIVDSTSPLKRARLDKTCEPSSARCSSLIDNNLEFNFTVDGASFIDSEQASLIDEVNFSPNRNGFIDDFNRLTEENNRLKQDYENHTGTLKREIHELNIKYKCDIDHLKRVNLRLKRKPAALLSRERRNQNEKKR